MSLPRPKPGDCMPTWTGLSFGLFNFPFYMHIFSFVRARFCDFNEQQATRPPKLFLSQVYARPPRASVLELLACASWSWHGRPRPRRVPHVLWGSRPVRRTLPQGQRAASAAYRSPVGRGQCTLRCGPRMSARLGGEIPSPHAGRADGSDHCWSRGADAGTPGPARRRSCNAREC